MASIWQIAANLIRISQGILPCTLWMYIPMAYRYLLEHVGKELKNELDRTALAFVCYVDALFAYVLFVYYYTWMANYIVNFLRQLPEPRRVENIGPYEKYSVRQAKKEGRNLPRSP